MSTQTLSWQAREFKHYPKNLGWYITFIAISILVVAFFVIIQNDIFAAVSLALLALLMLFFSRHKPEIVKIELNSKGLKFDNIFYPYKQLKYFWTVHNERHKTVNFATSAMVNNVVILELEDQDPDKVRTFLLQYLPEHESTEETPAQRFMHRFRF